ncbi:hypothetical protein CQW23_32341 [Capsicum baccatum]|uniref:J domain-containing protein n=1 Tax=Capsicum baccatum TaxID=33114 RepID=A0A2G2V513_CAPBA|nr:hypothetical protein CQW23_32341 [Capsicum baccatum]
MECNKDEAVRAKTIAEQKLAEKDIAGAQKFALKAQNLFPGLDGLSQFLEVVAVYVAYEKKTDGEVDIYGVLSVEPSADNETIRKNYRRLALALHPDKNKSVGADGAFKIISEAWSLLSDRKKRMMYDNRHAARNASMQGNQPGFHNFSVHPANARCSTNVNVQPAPVAPHPSKPETFWTFCYQCQIRYEYFKIHLNKSIMCPRCHRPFYAREVGAPVKNQASSFPWFSRQQQQGTNYPVANEYSASGVKLPTASNSVETGFSGPGSTFRANIQQGHVVNKRATNGARPYVTTARQDAHSGQPAVGILKRPRAEAASTSSKADKMIKKRRAAELKSKFQGKGMVNELAAKGGSSSQGNTHRSESLRAKPKSSGELSDLEIRSMLANKARMEISKKLKEWSTTAASRTSSKKEKEVEKKKQSIKSELRRDRTAHAVAEDSKISREQENLPVFSAPSDLESEAKSMTVPDPDFHNFDKDRTEKSFDDKQVWAAYDDDDGMTRFYALIHKVISRKPFSVQLSWLNSRNNSELGPIDWVGSGFLKTSGNFRIGRHETSKTLNSFSHKVKWVKGVGGVIQIFPRKGDVWALYRHWSPKWNELTPDDIIHKYDMVEVLADYTEKEGVPVAPLVKAAGFTSVFRRHLGPTYLLRIPREEMFRFSHQVPSYLLTGQEAPNAPPGCWELDPAALPSELVRVMTDAEIEAHEKVSDTLNLERTCGESKEKEKSDVVCNNNVTKCDETHRDCKSVFKQPMATYSRKKKEKAEAGAVRVVMPLHPGRCHLEMRWMDKLLMEPFSESRSSILIGASPKLMSIEVIPIGYLRVSSSNRDSFSLWSLYVIILWLNKEICESQIAGLACPFGRGDPSMNSGLESSNHVVTRCLWVIEPDSTSSLQILQNSFNLLPLACSLHNALSELLCFAQTLMVVPSGLIASNYFIVV